MTRPKPNTRLLNNYIFKLRDFQTFKYVVVFHGLMNGFIIILTRPDEIALKLGHFHIMIIFVLFSSSVYLA